METAMASGKFQTAEGVSHVRTLIVQSILDTVFLGKASMDQIGKWKTCGRASDLPPACEFPDVKDLEGSSL